MIWFIMAREIIERGWEGRRKGGMEAARGEERATRDAINGEN